MKQPRALDLNNAIIWLPWAWVGLATLICTGAVAGAVWQLFRDIKKWAPQESPEGYIVR